MLGNTRNHYHEIIDSIVCKTAQCLPVHGNRCPEIGHEASPYAWHYTKDFFWTESFWVGQTWLAFMLTGEPRFLHSARAHDYQQKYILGNPQAHSHDLGFAFSLSSIADYKLTGCEEARSLALRAADIMRSRFQLHGKFIQAWGPSSTSKEQCERASGKMIIDCMQNLPLLFWAARERGECSFYDIAVAHAEATQKHIVRKDYSTFHCFNFDPVYGTPLKGVTHQGYSDDSCWSRGQAWAVHGFAQTYLHTGRGDFLETAAGLADYVIAHLPADAVPLWDYSLRTHEGVLEQQAFRDSSAGAITAAGLYLIAEAMEQNGQAERSAYYRQWGDKMLGALRNYCDLTADERSLGLLSEGASHVKWGGRWANAMLPYGDYYYFEAALRGAGFRKFFW
ncbi:MAG: glycoside hydrolase family 88 protein [Spirochaetota bacterium]